MDAVELTPASPANAKPASVMTAVSAGIDAAGNTYVVLYWSPYSEATGYNLYRSVNGGKPGRRPINGAKPIAAVKTCAELKAIIPEGSPEWDLLTNAFTGLAGSSNMQMGADSRKQAYVTDPSTLIAMRGLRGYPGKSAQQVKQLIQPSLVDPCTALSRGLTAQEAAVWDTLAHINLKLRQSRGLAYIDQQVIPGKTYTYELRGVLKNGHEVSLVKGVSVIAGTFLLPDPPSGFSISAGDRQVLSLWNSNPYAYSYTVERSTNPFGPYLIINDTAIWLNVEKDLQGNLITPPRPGFVDYQRWDDNGLPVTHLVNGIPIDGPKNDLAYYYKVASVDILGRVGSWSSALPATPVCTTPPMAPNELKVDPVITPPALLLTWRKVTRDIANHQIQDNSQTYRIYRADTQAALEDISGLAAYLVGTLTADPTDATTPTLSWYDTDPSLVPPFGVKDFWYRLACVDIHGNQSAPSALIAGRIPDITPPGPTLPTGSEGFADHIRIYWKPNSEPDLAGYQVWRGVCDQGNVYSPDREKRGCDFVLVGDLPLAVVKQHMDASGTIYFDDMSVPAGSPICYAYWVRAYDTSQNLYPGHHGCPASAQEYICQRLYEQTPPPAPVITGLRARNDSVQVEWIGPPVQDLRAFHVYRGDKENDPPQFIGCMLSDGTPYPGKWKGMKPQCADIPADPDPTMSQGSFLDTTVKPEHIYWYRVSALDWLGNESEGADLLRLPAISTFTYTRDLPVTPSLVPPLTQANADCGMLVAWMPAYDANLVEGFVVFRSTSAGGNYRQVSEIIKDNSFTDSSARHGVDYWYRVQAINKDGRLSPPSAPLLYRY